MKHRTLRKVYLERPIWKEAFFFDVPGSLSRRSSEHDMNKANASGNETLLRISSSPRQKMPGFLDRGSEGDTLRFVAGLLSQQ